MPAPEEFRSLAELLSTFELVMIMLVSGPREIPPPIPESGEVRCATLLAMVLLVMVTSVPEAVDELLRARPPPHPSVTTLSWILQLVTGSVPAPALRVLLPSHSMPPPDPSAAKLPRFMPNRISRLVRCVSNA